MQNRRRTDRVAPKIIGGPYSAPKCRVGRILGCLYRGDRVVTGITDAPIPWPYSPARRPGQKSLFVVGDLVRALATESSQAITYHWGISRPQVTRLKRALGIGAYTVGTIQLARDLYPLRLNRAASVKGGKATKGISKKKKAEVNDANPTT